MIGEVEADIPAVEAEAETIVVAVAVDEIHAAEEESSAARKVLAVVVARLPK